MCVLIEVVLGSGWVAWSGMVEWCYDVVVLVCHGRSVVKSVKVPVVEVAKRTN